MNSHPETNPHDSPDSLPDDLLALAGALDRLAAAERASMSPDALARLGDLPRMTHLAQVQQHLDADAIAHHDAAPPGLEPRVFARSRPALREAAPAPLPFDSPAQAKPAVVIRWASAARLAAAIAVLAGGVIAIRTLGPSPAPAPLPGPGTAEPIAVAPPSPASTQGDAADTVFALLASIDTTARTRELEDLVSEADGLMASIREPARAGLFIDSSTDRQ